MLTMHFGLKMMSNLPNLTLECLPAWYSILLTDVWVLPQSGRCEKNLQQVLQQILDLHLSTPYAPPPHLHTNYLPFFVPPRLSTPDDTLPMPDCLILRGRSAPTHLTPYPRNYSVWKHTISNHSKGTHGALIHSLVDHTPLGIAPWPSFNAL